MKKICFIISGNGYSGAEIVLERYLENNQEIDPYFVIIYKNHLIEENFKLKYGKNKVFSLNLKLNKFILNIIPRLEINKIYTNINNLIKKINPDVLYSNNTLESMLMYKFIKESGVKSIAHIHDMKSNLRGFIKKKYIINSLNNYNKVIMVSNAAQKDWREVHSLVVYNGLEENYFQDGTKIYKSIKKIGFVGGLNKRKGIDILIKNIFKLIREGYEINIVTKDNNGKIFNLLKKYSQTNDSVNLYIDLSKEEIKKFMREIDVLIVPSRFDPLPTVVMEAMAEGTIVIGNDIESIREMIGQELFLYKNNDLFNCLQRVRKMSDKELNNISNQLKSICKLKFSNENKKKTINDIISELVE